MPWEAIKWVSSGLTLAAFIAACFVYFRVKSLKTDREILKGTEDAKKLPILQALRDRMPLRFENLEQDATERLALRELERLQDRDRRGFVALLVGLVLMTAVIIFSIWRSQKEELKSAEAELAVEYARLFGAVETPIIVQIQGAGGKPVCPNQVCNFSDPMEDVEVTKVDYEVHHGHFSPTLGKFWETWPYKTALPIATPLWKEVNSDGRYGFTLLNRASSRLGDCVRSIIVPKEEDPSISREPGKPNCQLSDSKRVGFLFIILKNVSNQEMRDIALTYFPLPIKTGVADYLETLKTDSSVIGAQQKTIAGLKPGESVILLISIYDRNSDGFETRFLADGIVPREVSFVVSGQKQSMAIRSPRRERAFVATLPNGWYLQ